MGASSSLGIIILIFTGLTTYKAFIDKEYMDRYIFDVDRILIDKEYVRLVSSGFLHANWIHFGFNMIALTSFAMSVEHYFGPFNFLLIYFASLIGGDLLALFIHRNHGDYRSLGASGAISGIVMAAIILYPEGEISFIFLPFGISSWIFGLLFVVISIFGIKSQTGNIGHDAHLGGALVGVLMTLIIKPSVLVDSGWVIVLILVPIIIFLYLIIYHPAFLLVDDYFGLKTGNRFEIRRMGSSKIKTKKRKPASSKEINEAVLNRLLDKINKTGMESLSAKEKKQLEWLRDRM